MNEVPGPRSLVPGHNGAAPLRGVSLTKTYEDGRVQALRGASLELARGETVTVMGPSGSGKSTLLHLMGALDRPTSGEVFVQGEPLSAKADLDVVRARHLGFVFQLHNLLPHLSAAENVEIPMFGQGVSARERRARARELVARVGLAPAADRRVTKLSGGERQRVAVARALANGPAVVLADEPTGNLDSRAGRDVMELLLGLQSETGLALLVVTHDPAVAAYGARKFLMRDGLLEAAP